MIHFFNLNTGIDSLNNESVFISYKKEKIINLVKKLKYQSLDFLINLFISQRYCQKILTEV